MLLRLRDGLLFASATVEHGGLSMPLDAMLVDTGSAGTLLSADRLLEIGIGPAPGDRLRRVFGVGGAEYVFEKVIDRLAVGAVSLPACTVEVGALDYGVDMDGILGLDFLRATGVVLDLDALTLQAPARGQP